jgi:hypothetical protein
MTGTEQFAPVDWEAIARQREAELKTEGAKRHQAESDLKRVQQAACISAENLRNAKSRLVKAEAALKTLAPMFEGLHRLIATSSRDWSEYRVDAWLWAVLVGWDCEEAHTHDETCEGGSLEEIAAMHGWAEAAVTKARRYRAAVQAAAARG